MLRLTIALCLILAAPAAARPGDLDRTFGLGGRIAFAVGDGYSSASGMVLDGHDRAVLAGVGITYLPPNDSRYRITAARLTTAGRLDPAFGSGGSLALIGAPNAGPLTYTPQLIARAPGGAAAIAGAVESERETHAEVYRFDAAGRQDMSFGNGGVATVSGAPHLIPAALAVQDGRILLLATVYKRGLNGFERAVLIRLNADGSVDRRITVGENVRAGALLASGTSATVAVYQPGRKGHPGRVMVSAFRPDGSRDGKTVRFALHSRRAEHDAGPVALVRGPGRTVVVAGNDASGGSWGGAHWPWVARISAGRLDRRFSGDGRMTPVTTHSDFSVRAATVDRHGRVVLAGARGSEDVGAVTAIVVRVTPAGRRDKRLGVRRVQLGAQRGVTFIGSEPRAVAIDRRGRIVLAGVAFDDDVAIREDLGRSYFAAARLRG